MQTTTRVQWVYHIYPILLAATAIVRTPLLLKLWKCTALTRLVLAARLATARANGSTSTTYVLLSRNWNLHIPFYLHNLLNSCTTAA